MAKKKNAKDFRISVRCSRSTFDTMKILAERYSLSDSDVIEYALNNLLLKQDKV